MKRTHTTSARLAFLASLVLGAPACVDAPVYSAHLHQEEAPLLHTELQAVSTSPVAARVAPLTARLGTSKSTETTSAPIPSADFRPLQYVTLGETVILRIVGARPDLPLDACDVVWRFENREIRGNLDLDVERNELRATLPAEAAAPGHWSVEIRHPALGTDAPLLRHFEVLRVTPG